jgi:hypothetical protein
VRIGIGTEIHKYINIIPNVMLSCDPYGINISFSILFFYSLFKKFAISKKKCVAELCF